MRYPKILILVLLNAFAAVASFGQAVNFQFYCAGPVPKGLASKQGERYVPFNLISGAISRQSYSNTGASMQLYLPDAKGGSGMVPAGKVDFKNGPGTYIVAISSLTPTSVITSAMKESSADFPGGAGRVFNLTKAPVTIEFTPEGGKDQKMDVPPGGYAVGKFGGSTSITYHVLVKMEDRVAEVKNDVWHGNSTLRNTAAVYNSNAEALAADPKAPPSYSTITYYDDVKEPAVGGGNNQGGGASSGNGQGSGNQQGQGQRRRGGGGGQGGGNGGGNRQRNNSN